MILAPKCRKQPGKQLRSQNQFKQTNLKMICAHSYMTRHDVTFDDLLARDARLEEIRAYVLLRQSGLSAEDRKKVMLGGSYSTTVPKRAFVFLGHDSFKIFKLGDETVRNRRHMMSIMSIRSKSFTTHGMSQSRRWMGMPFIKFSWRNMTKMHTFSRSLKNRS